MRPLLVNSSLTLAIISLFCITTLSMVNPFAKHSSLHALAGRNNPVIVSTPTIPCLGTNCATDIPTTTTNYCPSASSGLEGPSDFKVICDVDFPSQNIFPFFLVEDFDSCLGKCIDYNENNNETKCEGFVFAPERTADSNDCYLKSALAFPMSATIPLIGATIISDSVNPSTTCTSQSIAPIPPSDSAHGGLVASDRTNQAAASVTPGSLSVKDVSLLGSSSNNPTQQYVSHAPYSAAKVASGQLNPGIDTSLITDYGTAIDTGCWHSNDFRIEPSIANMKTKPHMSRDGGKGGNVNGSNIFIFCDTGNYNDDGMLGLVSSSVALDQDMNGLQSKAITIVDQLGEWQDDVGRMRGFAPLTEGEEAFNIALSGKGYRYAVWPESAPIPLNSTHALIFANLIYDEVNMDTQAYKLTTLGNTLLLVSVDSTYGPYAERVANLFFTQNQVTYGSLGGFRAWGTSGVGGDDGSIYLFGNVPNGVFIAKTSPASYTDITSYSFWDGHQWSSGMPDQFNQDALILNETILDLDIIYAPAFNNFLMVYTTYNPDNTFYYRFLDPKSSTNLIPPYSTGGDQDYAEAIVKGTWSARHVLYQAQAPPQGSLYAGGVHAGYFGNDDITNGGKKMLITWTEHTGQDPTSEATGYALMAAVVDFN